MKNTFFSDYNNVNRNNILRLNLDGSLDTTFNTSVGFSPVYNPTLSYTANSEPTSGLVRSMILDATRIYVSGDFVNYNGVAVQRVVRLLASNGTIDPTTFSMGDATTTGGPNGNVYTMYKQGAKLILGGSFTQYKAFGGIITSATNITRILPSANSVELKSNIKIYEKENKSFSEVDNSLTLYPNPTNGKFNLVAKSLQNEILFIEIYNITGQKVYSKISNTNEYEYDTTNLIKGTYFVKIYTNQGICTKSLLIN